MTDTLTIDKLAGGVALVTMDDPARSVNALSVELLSEFEEKLVPLIDDPQVKALVLASAKEHTFIAGADIKGFNQTDDGDLVSKLDGAYSRALTKLARSPKPLVAAVHGAALGGGLEVALACDYILATEHPATQLGLPEVQLGILPAAGGTQRLPARVGLMKGLTMMLVGQRVRAKKALAIGLIDEIVAREDLVDLAIERARDLASGALKPPKRKRTLAERVMALPIVRPMIFNKVRQKVRKQTHGHYPGPLRIVDCVERGLAKGEDAAFDLEIRSIGELFVTPQARSLLWLFVAGSDLKDQSEVDQAKKVERVAVVGAGLMGAGIASVSVARAEVVVRDLDQAALQRCQGLVTKGIAKQLASGAITEDQAQERKARLSLTSQAEDLANADLVIESVFEDLELKQLVLAQAEEFISPQAVFASNTSSLTINQIAAKAKHPERVVGMHYFPMVPKMPLVELVVPDGAADWAVHTARAFGLAQGKVVITVKDVPGFFTNRLLNRYLCEALGLVAEGASIEAVDKAMADFGFPGGPLALIDLVGIDVAAKVSSNLSQAYEMSWTLGPEVMGKMREAGFQGRKNARGFYTYAQDQGNGKPQPNAGAYDFFADREERSLDSAKMAERGVLAMVNEAARTLEEGVIATPGQADLAAVMGLGFPPFRGGPFHYIDQAGADVVSGRLQDLAADLGERFAPSQTILDAAASGKKFFPRPNS